MLMERRKLLATAGLGIGGITGCLGSGENSKKPTEDTSGDENPATTDSCPDPLTADGLIGETIESEGIEYTVEELYTADSYTGYSEENTLAGATFAAVQISATVVAEAQRSISGEYLLEPYYKGVKMNKKEVTGGELTINGTPLTLWASKTGGLGSEKYPGEGIEGAFLFDIPADFDTADLRLSIWPSESVRQESSSPEVDKLHVRGKGKPNKQFCVSEEPPAEAQIGNSITYAGLRISIVNFTSSKTLSQEGWDREADEGAVFLIPEFTIENVSPVPRQIPDAIEVTYADQRVGRVPELETENFTVNGNSHTALYNRERAGRETDGHRIFPGVSIDGGLGFEVPEQFDESQMSITMEVEDETIQWMV